MKRQSYKQYVETKSLKTSGNIMSLKPEGFKNLKTQENVPDQVNTNNTVIFGTYLYHGKKDRRNDNDNFQ